MLKTTLLKKERTNIDRLLQPLRASWKQKGVSIVIDGWGDIEKRPLINIMAVTDGSPMFLKAVDCSGETMDKFFIANVMKEAIIEVGPENVVQVITEDTPSCKGAGQLIEAQFPSIFWTPCVVHILNLVLENICAAKNVEDDQVIYGQCNWIVAIASDVTHIKQFVTNHSMKASILSEFVTLKLLSAAETRFASLVVALRRFKRMKHDLQAMVISEKWASYRNDDVGIAKFIKRIVLADVWWDSIDYVLSFTAPIYDMLEACSTDIPCLHLVYDMWSTMIEKVKTAIYRHEGIRHDESSSFYEVVHQILVDGWNRNITPFHHMAHLLNPRYYSDEWLQEDRNRISPYKDAKVSRERVKCLKKYFPSYEERTKFNMEYSNFSCRSGHYEDSDSIQSRFALDARGWWTVYGAFTPMIQNLAFKLLVQPSSCCGRNWSNYSFMQSIKLNKMTRQCAKDMIFVHNNLRLLSRRTPEYMQGESRMWDIGADAFGSFEDVSVFKFANLSLDEPELETLFLTDDDDDKCDDEDMEVGSNDA